MPDATVPPFTLAAVIGSLRAGSFHRVVFEAARTLVPTGVELVEASIRDVPLFDQDIEDAGDPPEVMAFKAAVAEADALVIFTPEYNRSVPGVTKKAVDWLSRPFLAGPLATKPVGIVAVSPGRGDGAAVREHLAQGAAGAGGVVYEPSLGIASFTRVFADGDWIDPEPRNRLAEWLDGFVEFARDAGRDGASEV